MVGDAINNDNNVELLVTHTQTGPRVNSMATDMLCHDAVVGHQCYCRFAQQRAECGFEPAHEVALANAWPTKHQKRWWWRSCAYVVME
jgi:hypothetical protein